MITTDASHMIQQYTMCVKTFWCSSTPCASKVLTMRHFPVKAWGRWTCTTSVFSTRGLSLRQWDQSAATHETLMPFCALKIMGFCLHPVRYSFTSGKQIINVGLMGSATVYIYALICTVPIHTRTTLAAVSWLLTNEALAQLDFNMNSGQLPKVTLIATY